MPIAHFEIVDALDNARWNLNGFINKGFEIDGIRQPIKQGIDSLTSVVGLNEKLDKNIVVLCFDAMSFVAFGHNKVLANLLLDDIGRTIDLIEELTEEK